MPGKNLSGSLASSARPAAHVEWPAGPEDLQSATQSELYGYDAVYRVTGFKRGQLNEDKTDITSPSRTQTWTLDKLGNWGDTTIDSTTETRTHNDVNELTQRTVGGNNTDLTYDDAGNLIQDGAADGSHQYVWDYRNRLIEAKEKQSGSYVTVGTYKYDAQGRRIRKAVTNKGGLNSACDRREQTSREWPPLRPRVPHRRQRRAGRNGKAGRNGTACFIWGGGPPGSPDPWTGAGI